MKILREANPLRSKERRSRNLERRYFITRMAQMKLGMLMDTTN